MIDITIERLEALIQTREENTQLRRAKLLRLISAYARIVALVQPEEFEPHATEYSDKDGHWDNSYPPTVEYKNKTGPRLIKLDGRDWEEIATSRGFYHSYKVVTTDRGVYVDRKGRLWGGDMTGTGEFGQFAAHPGQCNVQCEIEWSLLNTNELDISLLEVAEAKLRQLAFPLLTAAQP